MGIFERINLPVLILLLSEVVLILLFPPSLIFESTVTAGGDTPSHFISAVAMGRGPQALLSPVAWIHGAYGGFPLFLQYFPLPFATMAIISLVFSLKIAFKLVTLLAIIPLPAAAWFCLRRLGYGRNTAAIGAVLSLPFLFITENSMWGGNILSTLAGEFSFGISLVLYVFFTGKLYDDISRRAPPWGNSILEALIAMSNGYPLLQAAMGSSYFLLRGGNVRYVVQLHAAAFGLAAFWLLPVLWRIPWNTPFVHAWHFRSWVEIAPPLMWPAFAGVLMIACSGIRALFRSKTEVAAIFRESTQGPVFYLFWQFAIALLAFSLGSSAGLVDIRFLPFAQIMTVLLGAVGWSEFISRLRRTNLWLAVFSAGIIALALTRTAAIDPWIQWNYSGMESKPLWNSYRLVNQYLSGDQNSPRVVYEHNQITNAAGTVRAFELLPYYSGRSTLEGIYMQSTLSSPFVFYIQSELSQIPSSPFSQYYYSRPDTDRAAAHLRLFNVNQVIAVSGSMADALDHSSQYEPSITIPPYRIYHLRECAGSYVEPLRFKPLRIPYQDWKKAQFEWFRKSSLKVPLIVASKASPGNYWKELENYDGIPERIPEAPFQQIPENSGPLAEIPATPAPRPPVDLPADDIRASADLGDGRITIDTSRPGHPLWIKVSYHPDWRISEGAGELYPASPAFMLLVPQTPRVVLTFDTATGIYLWGRLLSLFTIVIITLKILSTRGMFPLPFSRCRPRWIPARWSNDRPKCHDGIEAQGPRHSRFGTSWRFFLALVLMAFVILGALWTRNHRDPVLLYELAAGKLTEIDMGQSAPATSSSSENLRVLDLLDECIEKFGHSSVMDQAMFSKASLIYARHRWDDLHRILESFLEENPDSRIQAAGFELLGEASVNMGKKVEAERFFRKALYSWPENGASKQAGLLLAEMLGDGPLFEEAQDLMNSGNNLQACNIYGSLALSSDTKVRDEAVLSLAYCYFYMNRFEEACNLFVQWRNGNMESPESARVQADLTRCRALLFQNNEWLTGNGSRQDSSTSSGIIARFFNRVARGMH